MGAPNPQVDPQITDAVTQSNVSVVGDACAMAMANLYQATGQALSNAAQWSTTTAQNAGVTAQASTVMGVTTLYGISTATTADGIADILEAR